MRLARASSRVIAALGSSSTHVNFRDSKLTRILQPALSGNARMAIICCATPSELYLNETRTSLQFASRAKRVKTHAEVNEVLDDRSLIRRLQRELALAKRISTSHSLLQFNALKIEAANANRKAERSEKNLQRLKLFILRGGLSHGFMLPQVGGEVSAERPATPYSSADTYCNVSSVVGDPPSPIGEDGGWRRMSEGGIDRTSGFMNGCEKEDGAVEAGFSKAKSLASIETRWMSDPEKLMDRTSDIAILKEAFNQKAIVARSMQDENIGHAVKMQEHDVLVFQATEDIELATKRSNNAPEAKSSDVAELITARNTLEEEKQRMVKTHTMLLKEGEKKKQDAVKAMEQILADTKNAGSMLVSLQSLDEDFGISAWQGNENKKLKKRIQELMSDNKKILQQHHRLEQEKILLEKPSPRSMSSYFDEEDERIKMKEDASADRSELERAGVDTNDLEGNALSVLSTFIRPGANAVSPTFIRPGANAALDKQASTVKRPGTNTAQDKQVVDASKELEVTSQNVLAIKANHDKEILAFNKEVARLSTEKANLTSLLNKAKQEAESHLVDKSKLAMEIKGIRESLNVPTGKGMWCVP